MSKIPTAREFYDKHHSDDAVVMMKDFAKLHVEAALKEALESIPCLGSSTDISTYEEVEDAVLNSYPFDLIK